MILDDLTLHKPSLSVSILQLTQSDHYCKNAENLVASTLNLLRHGGLERVTDDDDDDEITESHGLIKRWLWKMVLVTSVSEEGTL